MFVKCKNPQKVAKRFFYLAYLASGVFGMGMLQARENATEDEVYNNIRTRGDYPRIPGDVIEDRPSADYVFGRMMKVSCTIKEDGIEISESKLDPSYQSWATTYKTRLRLLEKAISEVENEKV